MLKIIGIVVLAIIAFVVLQLAFGWWLGGVKMRAVRRRGVLSFMDENPEDKQKKS